MMTIKHNLLTAVAAGLLFSGCTTEPGRKTAVGAGVGGLIGGAVGNAKEANEKGVPKPKE